ncbi:recombinase family protein [Ralstonia solanacearum]|uniref:recombinase family protein n=2 Tax=Ralstonia solanacearum TaxID=305 RepID=UPI0006963C0F|nr:recombinase family protein [Ralstonia solanacearum]MDC6180619.1 recombinase family protein [Ralstonia solanacearum]MDC6210369.1 recombinase family protein [Ralstonia solanacearum]MDC6242220.1 recombinase family protein [Ralstonia solanacearum]MDD7800196.1 recombinase family protein [Ralstonia solanacearum]TYZ50824.1 recombinase family protein [Ralstonia solanacearum]
MPVAYSYIRFSTPEQIRGDSLRRQLEASAKYAADHGLTLDQSLNVRDLGVSAFTGSNIERGALGQFVAAIDEGRVQPDSYLLVESLDRLSRLPVTEALAVFQSIINRGITIVTLVDSAVYSKDRLRNDWTPLLIALVSMSRAHEESAVKSRRIKAAYEARKKRVIANKEMKIGRCPWWLKLSDDKTKYEVIEESAATIRLMFDLAKDGMGNALIAKELNARGIPTAQHSKYWQNSTVGFNLTNIALIGVLQMDQDNNGRTTTNTFVEDYYPPIIDKTLFYEVQAMRKARDRNKGTMNAGRKGQCYNIFQGTAKCGYCGSPMHIRRKPGINTGFLYCSKSLQGGGCVSVSYNIRNLESEFIMFTRELDLHRVLGETSTDNGVTAKRASLAACNARVEEAETKLKNLVAAIETGGDMPILVQRLRDVEAQINDLKKQRLALQSEVQILSNTTRDEEASLQVLSQLMDQLESKETALDEKLRLRFRMLSEVQKVVRRLDLFPGGPMLASDENEGLRSQLKDSGFDDSRIDDYFSQLPRKPDRTARYFIAHLRNGICRTVGQGKVLEMDPMRSQKIRTAIERVIANKVADDA